jgi:TetR/AcrR family transcriptional regulator, acrAB operon repressor
LARQTKENALATRHSLLNAAELLFQAQGVSRTSLNDIARSAGASRGAIYWHFKDKADLFNAMMERVTLPLEQTFQFQHPEQEPDADPLERIRQVMHDALRQIATDARTRRVFEVATQKVEYVDELHAVRVRHLTVRNGFLVQMEHGLALAAAAQNLNIRISIANAAQGLHAMADGLIQNWLLDTTAFDLVASSEQVIDIYLRGLGFRVEHDSKLEINEPSTSTYPSSMKMPRFSATAVTAPP